MDCKQKVVNVGGYRKYDDDDDDKEKQSADKVFELLTNCAPTKVETRRTMNETRYRWKFISIRFNAINDSRLCMKCSNGNLIPSV